MRMVRNRVRLVALAWLLSQVASLAAFGPDRCCVSHSEEAAAKARPESCHESAPPGPAPEESCPMHHGDGAACPMKSSNTHDCCAMKNGCDGPGQQLANLLSFLATPESPASSPVQLRASLTTVAPSSPFVSRTTSPDAPPPKA